MPGENTKSAGKALKQEREIRGWSRKYVAERTGSDVQSVGRWERGETSPNAYYRQQLCELFEKDARALGLLPESADTGQSEAGTASTRPDREKWQEQREESESKPLLNNQAHHARSHRRRALQGLPTGIVIATLAIVTGILLLSLWRSQAIPFAPFTPRPPTWPTVLPGGLWISPLDGQSYRGTVHFEARAYPSAISSPSIKYVNFTAKWEGGWRIVCTVHAPVVADLYSCNVNLGQHGAPAGSIRISFDVYDQAGTIHSAPNGEHTILYTP